jgi:hypothetical protein
MEAQNCAGLRVCVKNMKVERLVVVSFEGAFEESTSASPINLLCANYTICVQSVWGKYDEEPGCVHPRLILEMSGLAFRELQLEV